MPKRLRSPSNLETNSNQNETPYPNDLYSQQKTNGKKQQNINSIHRDITKQRINI